jgi:hypothetical protein
MVRQPLFGLLYQPQMIDDDECGPVSGIRISRGNRSTWRKPAPVPLCPPQIPNDLTWDRTRAATMGSLRITAWAMPRLLARQYMPMKERKRTTHLQEWLQRCYTFCIKHISENASHFRTRHRISYNYFRLFIFNVFKKSENNVKSFSYPFVSK